MHWLTIRRLYDIKLLALIASIFYLAVIYIFVGLTFENYLIAIGYNFFIWLSSRTRKFLLAFTVFVVFGILYDFLKVFPNYLFNKVDITGIYSFEKALFGIHYLGAKLTLNEYFSINNNTVMDIVSSLFYINWIPVPLAFAIFLFFTDKKQYLYYSLTFLLVNLIGFALYYIHPAAPPWYVDLYGFELDTTIKGHPAAFGRFDSLIDYPLFSGIYSRNSNVFAAIPSLHCAYPVIVLVYGIRNRLTKVNWFFMIFLSGIWFASVYSGHHYVTDVILGLLVAITGIFIFDKLLLKTVTFKRFISGYLTIIT